MSCAHAERRATAALVLILATVLLSAPDAQALQAPPAGTSPVSPAGVALARLIDGLDVEHRWLAGHAVHWRTGRDDARGHQHATHCSAFAAAVCERYGVYLLRPPEHSQELLANAQNHWLKTEGAREDWRWVRSPEEAQALANLGVLVLVSYLNPDRHRPGHIAVVPPSGKPEAAVASEGPQVAQAGRVNSRGISLRQGFAHHAGVWEGRGVDFFAHAAPPTPAGPP